MLIKLRNVRIAFPHLFERDSFEGKPTKYGATFLIPKGDPQIKLIEDEIAKVAQKKFGAKCKETLASIKGISSRYCFQDGDKLDKAVDGYAGHMFIGAKNDIDHPNVGCIRVVGHNRDIPLTLETNNIYGGCYVNANIDIYAYNNKGSKGISATLSAVQYFKDGDAFSGGAPARAEDFDDLTVSSDVDDLI